MPATVRVDARPLELFGPISDLVDTTAWRRGADFSGDFEASCTWSPPEGFTGSWCRRGVRFEVVEEGYTSWGGLVTDVQRGDDGWQISAAGLGAEATRYAALDATIPTAITRARNDGLPWQIDTSVTGPNVPNTGQDVSLTLADLLGKDAQAIGRRWALSTDGLLTYATDPTIPDWYLTPGTGVLAVADTNYVSHLIGRYVSAVTNGQPTAWGYAYLKGNDLALANATALVYGRVERVVDLTALGLLTLAQAETNIAGRYALVGARMGYTDRLLIGYGTLLASGSGPASPMRLRAGQMLSLPDVYDDASRVDTTGGARIVAGQVERNHTDGTATVTPVGFTPRDYEGALEAAQTPVTAEAA